MREGIMREPILVVSPWFEAHRDEYQDGLLELSQSGSWESWIALFATGIAAAAAATRERVEDLLKWQERTLLATRDAGISGLAERITSDLIGMPVLRAAQVAEQHKVSHQGAMNALRRLVDFGILDERVAKNGRKVFVAPEVVRLLSR